MGFFDKLTDIVSNTSKDLSKKAKDLVSTGKLEGQIAEEEEKIQNTYLLIGTQYYEANKDDESGPYAQMCKQITDSKAMIEELQMEVERLKGMQRCPNCQAAVSIEAAFCPSCGTKMPEVKKEEEPAGEDSKVKEAAQKVDETVEEVKEKVEETFQEVKEKVEEKVEELKESKSED